MFNCNHFTINSIIDKGKSCWILAESEECGLRWTINCDVAKCILCSANIGDIAPVSPMMNEQIFGGSGKAKVKVVGRIENV